MSDTNLENQQVGPFRILRRLGNKRQRVFEAFQVEQNRKVGLKFISLPPDVSRERALRKIQKEVRFLQRLSHPHLTQFYGAGVVEDRIFFAMELIDGEPLSAIISRRGRIAWDLAVQYAIQLAEVLEYLHSLDLLHSKLTPEKVLISNGQVKLTDLRMNRARRRRWDARKREELEVAAYLAPEQLLGEGATARSDLYSLGTILYEMVTGKIPYPPESLEKMARRKRQQTVQAPSQLAVDCPIWLDQVVQKLMAPDPRERYLSAAAAKMALLEVQRIDANKTSTVAQMAGGFNALNAGADKSEARRLLGKKEPLSEKQIEVNRRKLAIPFYMQTSLLVVGLIAASIAIGAAIYMITPSVDSALIKAERILEDEEAGLLAIRSSEKELERMIDRNPGNERIAEMEDAIESLKVKRLLRLAKRGNVGLQEPITKLFILAYGDDLEGEYRKSLEQYRKLIGQIEPESEKAYIRREAVRQAATVREHFANSIESQLKEAETAEQLEQALGLAVAAKSELGADERYSTWIESLEQRYPELKSIVPLDHSAPAEPESMVDENAQDSDGSIPSASDSDSLDVADDSEEENETGSDATDGSDNG